MEDRFQKTLKTRILQQIMTERRTIRAFDPQPPETSQVEQVLSAGQMAPFANFGTQAGEVRHFYVFPAGSSAREQIEQAFHTASAQAERNFQPGVSRWWLRLKEGLFFKKNYSPRSMEQLRLMLEQASRSSGHFNNLSNAPLLILVAEQRRGPGLAQWLDRQSLAHCMQNMWLMATALDLAFQPLSPLALLAEDERVCALLSLAPGQYALDGFLLGLPSGEARMTRELPFQPEQITWFK